MARGWESKSIEDQISERESQARVPTTPKLTPEQAQRRSRRDGLMLARTRTLTALQTVCDSRYRAHLERVLADLDSQLENLKFPQP
jgi:hypothetical protein